MLSGEAKLNAIFITVLYLSLVLYLPLSVVVLYKRSGSALKSGLLYFIDKEF